MPKRDTPFYLALLGIVALGALTRFWHLELFAYSHDQAEQLSRAIDFGCLHHFPLRAATNSVGFANPPGMIWLLAPAAAICPTALFLTGFVALLNTIAIWFTGLAGRKMAGHGAGLLAAALLAFSPFANLHSRFIWEVNVLVFFSSVLFWLMTCHLEKPRAWTLAGVILVAAYLPLVHPSPQAILPVPALALLLGWRRYGVPFWRKTAVVLGASVIAFGLWLPYQISQHIQAHDPAYAAYWDTSHWLDHGPKVPSPVQRAAVPQWQGLAFPAPLSMTLQIHSADFLEYWVGVFDDTLHVHRRLWRTYGLICSLALLLAMATASGIWSRRWWPRSPRRQMALLALLWLLLPAVALCTVRQLDYPHYFVICFPAGYLLMGRQAAVLRRLAGRNLMRQYRWLVLLCIAFSAALLLALANDLQEQHGFPEGNYGAARVETGGNRTDRTDQTDNMSDLSDPSDSSQPY